MIGPIEPVVFRPRLGGIALVAVQKSLALVNPSMVGARDKSGVVPWVIRSSPSFPQQRSSLAASLRAAKRARWGRCRARLHLSQRELLARPALKNALSMWSAPVRRDRARSSATNGLTGNASAGSLLVLRPAMAAPNRWWTRCCAIVNVPTRRQPRLMVRPLAPAPAQPVVVWAARYCRWSLALARSVSASDSLAAARVDRLAPRASYHSDLIW